MASKDSEADALGEESDKFDTDESPLHKGFELDMNMTDTDQTKVISFHSQLYLTGIGMKFFSVFLFIRVLVTSSAGSKNNTSLETGTVSEFSRD